MMCLFMLYSQLLDVFSVKILLKCSAVQNLYILPTRVNNSGEESV